MSSRARSQVKAAAAAAVATLAVTASAEAAQIRLIPGKQCYRVGESAILVGSGVTRAATSRSPRMARPLGFARAKQAGATGGGLTFGNVQGVRTVTVS
jgi:hypothetical protein